MSRILLRLEFNYFCCLKLQKKISKNIKIHTIFQAINKKIIYDNDITWGKYKPLIRMVVVIIQILNSSSRNTKASKQVKLSKPYFAFVTYAVW